MTKQGRTQQKLEFQALTDYIRQELGIDNKEQADKVGINYSTFTNYRLPDRAGAPPPDKLFEQLEKAYNITRQEWKEHTSGARVAIRRLQEEVRDMKAKIEWLTENQKLLSGYVTRDMTTDLDEYRNIAKRNSNKDQD